MRAPTPAAAARITVMPFALYVAIPSPSTVATDSSELLHWKLTPVIA